MAYTKFRPFVLLAATGVQPGSGSELGVVDKPIQREKHTRFPKIDGGGIKGVVKDEIAKRVSPAALKILLGPEDGDEHGSAAGFMDARLLFFPAATINGIFAWTTCPYVLKRFKQDMCDAEVKIIDPRGEEIDIGSIKPKDLAVEPADAETCVSLDGSRHDVVFEKSVLEGMAHNEAFERFIDWFVASFLNNTSFSLTHSILKARALAVPDNLFSDMVRHETEIIARNKIDDSTGTVAQTGPWYEEYLPQESILYSQAMARVPLLDKGLPAVEDPSITGAMITLDSDEKVLNMLTCTRVFPSWIQLGANATVGKGFLKLGMYSADSAVPTTADTGGKGNDAKSE